SALGFGMGFLMQTTMLIAQNSVAQKDMGVASSSAAFFRSIGGSFGVSLFGAIFVRRLHDDLATSVGTAAADKRTSGGGQVDPSKLRSMPSALVEPLYHGIASGLSHVFVWAIPFAAIVAILAVLIKEVPLRGSMPAADTADADSATTDTEKEAEAAALVAAMD